MKTLKCDLCGVTAQGETFEQWMRVLQPHYMQAHPEVMKESDHSKEDALKWMVENKARFDAAPI
jgi:hypothetical protein